MKYLFCYPQGGFCDTCNNIYICYEYCLKYNRILVIDTRYIYTLNDDIRKYFLFISEIIFKDDIDILFKSIINLTLYPIELNNIITIDNYESIIKNLRWTNIMGSFYYNDINFGIELNKDYNEDIIFYSKCGSGSILNLFKIIKFSNIVKDTINIRISSLLKDFISVHIRNTDYKSNIEEFLNINEKNFKNKSIFLACDNFKTIELFKNIYKTTFTFSNIPDIDYPIHMIVNKKFNIEEYIIDIISDFIILCYGKEFYCSFEVSGFSQNVITMRKNMDIINKLLEI